MFRYEILAALVLALPGRPHKCFTMTNLGTHGLLENKGVTRIIDYNLARLDRKDDVDLHHCNIRVRC